MAVSYRRSTTPSATSGAAGAAGMPAPVDARVRSLVRRMAERSPRSRRSTASRRAGPSGGRPTAPTASTATAERADVFSDRHPAADRVRLDPHGHRVRLHPDRHHRPLPADAPARPSSSRSAGTTTAWPPSAGCRTSTACAATRRSPTTPTSRRRSAATPPKDHQEVPISRPNFVELCHELTATDEAAFEELFRRLGLSFDWSLLYTTINDVSRRTSQLAFLRNLARGEAYSAEAPTLWDVDDRTAVAQAEIEDRERPGAYHLLAFARPRRRRADRHHPPRAGRQLRRPRRPPRRRALPLAVRLDGAHAAVRRRGPGRRPPAGRARQGHRHRHGLHVRRHHRRHVVARARPADAQRHRARRPLRRRRRRRG